MDAFLADRKGVSPQTIGPYLYRHEGRDAIHHLFRVAASLDSMVVGEPQILGQLKTAYAVAKDAGAVCGWLEGLLTRAFSVAKRVRSETGIGQMAVSVSYAAVELARKIFGSLNNRTVMIVGRRQDVGAGGAPPAAVGRLARLRHQSHARARHRDGQAVSGHAGRIHALREHAARGGYRDRLLAARRITSCARTTCSA